MPPDEDDQTPEEVPEDEAEEDLRDQRIAELEAALAAATEQLDAVSQALFASQVSALDLLVDPASLPYSPDLLSNPEALQAAVTALLVAAPHLAKIKVSGDVDQNAREEVSPPVPSLLGIMKEYV